MSDASIIAACLDSREAYDSVAPYLAPDVDLSPAAAKWWPLITEWYDLDESAKRIDRAALRGRGEERLPLQHRHPLLEWYDELGESISPTNAAVDLLSVKRQAAQQAHVAAVLSGDDDKASATWTEYEELVHAASLSSRPGQETLFFDPARSLEVITAGKSGIVLPPGRLSRAVGDLSPGDTVVLFGRPGVAKTLFSVAAAARAAQGGHRVLYLGNEEQVQRIAWRVIANMTGVPTATLTHTPGNFRKVLSSAVEFGFDNISWAQLTPGTIREIEHRVRVAEPELVIVDQIRNVQSRSEKTHERLEHVQAELRSMASKLRFACLSVTQACDDAAGRRTLEMVDVADCKTGVQGACDTMVGVGGNPADLRTGTRFVSLPKNKLGQVESSFPVTLNLDIQNFVE